MQRANYDDPIYQDTLTAYVLPLTLSVNCENTRRGRRRHPPVHHQRQEGRLRNLGDQEYPGEDKKARRRSEASGQPVGRLRR